MSNINMANNLIDKITADIASINAALCQPFEDQVALHKELDERYRGVISGWSNSMFNWEDGRGFNYYCISPALLAANLVAMRSKLLAFRSELSSSCGELIPAQIFQNYMCKVNLNGSNFCYPEARNVLSTLVNVTEEELTAALDVVNTIEQTINSKTLPHQKWESLSSVMTWLAAQPYNVAMCIIPLFLKI